MSTRPRKSMDTQRVPNRDLNASQRVQLALQARAERKTYEQCAAVAGYSSASACRKAIKRELDRCIVADVEQLRREELIILDTMHQEIWTLFIDKKNRGRLFAADRLLALSDARRKLLGLDAPTNGNVFAAQVVVREVPPNYLGEGKQP